MQNELDDAQAAGSSLWSLRKTTRWIFHIILTLLHLEPGRVAQTVGHLTRKSGVLGSIPGLATYFRFSFRFFKKGSCQLLAKVCARSTGKRLRRSKPAQEKCGRLTDRPEITLDVYRGRKTTMQQSCSRFSV